MKKTLPVVMLICLFLFITPLGAGEWNEISRLTFSGSAEQPTMVVDGENNTHIIFQENLGGRVALKYLKLDDLGAILIPSRTLISSVGDAVSPATALDDLGIHLVWWDSRSGNFGLFYTLLDLNGTQQGDERSLDMTMAEDRSPSEAPSIDLDRFGDMYLVWSQQGRNSDGVPEEEHGEHEELTPSVLFMKIDPEGNILVPGLRISSGYANGIQPAIELDDHARAHIVWSEDLTGNYEIYYTVYQDQGTADDPEPSITRLTDTPMESIMSSLLFMKGILYLSWSDGDSDGDVFSLHLAAITTTGLTMNIVVSDRGNALYPEMAADGSRIYIAWQDDRHSLAGTQGREAYDELRENMTSISLYLRRHLTGEQGFDESGDLTNWEIYLGVIETEGAAEENNTRVTSMQRASVTPEITVDHDGDLKLVWLDTSRSSGDLYYVDNSYTEFEERSSVLDPKEGSLVVIGGIGLLCLIYLLSGEGRRYALFRFLFLPLYTTISKDRLMENENRRQIVAIINSQEGITFTDLMEELGLKNGALAYHLYTLERRRYIKSVKDGKFRRFYPRGARVTGLSSLEEKIINVIRSNPSISQREIANLIESTPQTVNYNIKKLIQRGVVYLRKDGKQTQCNLTNPDM